jgi:hypothetical protein
MRGRRQPPTDADADGGAKAPPVHFRGGAFPVRWTRHRQARCPAVRQIQPNRSSSVIAPLLAVDTSLANFASTPLV